VGFVLALTRRSPQRRLLGASLAIATPTIILGFVPPVMVMPLLYYYSELSAALGLLVAVALGALAWSVTSMPSHVRSVERSRLSSRVPSSSEGDSARRPNGVSVVVPTRNGAAVVPETIAAFGRRLTKDDEIVVVENGSSDDTAEVLSAIASDWKNGCAIVVLSSASGLGEALRAGVLASSRGRVLLTADDLPFGFSDLDAFERLPEGTVVAIGSKAHPDSQVKRGRNREFQSRIFAFLRAALLQSSVGDSQGTFWVDGEWARQFAMHSREGGLMWTTELVLAAEQQGLEVAEVPVVLGSEHEKGSSRFKFADAWRSVIGFTRLAVYKDDYVNEDWMRATPPISDPSSAS
jgi:hypothetical protein